MILWFICSQHLIASDSIGTNKSVFLIPHLSFQQETNWAAGVAGAYYFKSKNISQISAVSGSLTYTLNNQFIVNVSPKLYSQNRKWYLWASLNFQNYPDYFYGLGNKLPEGKVGYVSRNFNFNLQPQYILNNRVYVGLLLATKYYRITTDSNTTLVNDKLFSQYDSDEWGQFRQMSVGAVAAYDSRNNQYYPENGVFLKSFIGLSSKFLGSTFSTFEYQLDARYFKMLGSRHTLAFQALFAGVLGENNIPFQLMPTVGGLDVLRGFRRGMYRDTQMASLQSEYRTVLYKRIKAVVFLAAGEVYGVHSTDPIKLKIAYGAGLRYRINDARVHLRFDVAKNNYGDKMQFYITATEAF